MSSIYVSRELYSEYPNTILDSNKVDDDPKEEHTILIRKACVSDVETVLSLINGFADSNLMLNRGPQYLYENIRDFIVVVAKNIPLKVDKQCINIDMIVGCCSLHVLWEDIAEIRSLAIQNEYQKMGLGSRMINYFKKESIQLGIKRLITFTLEGEFFRNHGFKPFNKNELSAKVWNECSRCPKYFQCDEIGMILEI